MSEHTCTRRLEFDAGHRVLGHEGKCASWHGHRWVAEITCQAAALDSVGRVIDFGAIKATVGRWIDDMWDHGMIIWQEDDEMLRAADLLASHKTFRLPFNPTSENMSIFLLHQVCPMVLPSSIEVVRVRLYETPNCYAEARKEN